MTHHGSLYRLQFDRVINQLNREHCKLCRECWVEPNSELCEECYIIISDVYEICPWCYVKMNDNAMCRCTNTELTNVNISSLNEIRELINLGVYDHWRL
jgi:hypothetical protein